MFLGHPSLGNTSESLSYMYTALSALSALKLQSNILYHFSNLEKLTSSLVSGSGHPSLGNTSETLSVHLMQASKKIPQLVLQGQ